MAVIQTKVPSVKTGLADGPNVNIDAFGGEQARNAQKLQKGLENLARGLDDLQETRNASAVMDAESKALDRLMEYENESLSREGENAQGLAKDTGKYFRDLEAEIGKDLKNDRQRKLFNQALTRQKRSTMGRMMGHERNQTIKAQEVSWNAVQKSLRMKAISNPTDENLVETVKEIRAKNKYWANERGLGEEWLKVRNMEDETTIHKSVLDNLREDSPERALEYLNNHGDRLDPAVRDGYKNDIEQRVMHNELTNSTDAGIKAGVSFEDAMADLAKKYDGDDLEKMETVVKSRYANAKKIEAVRADEAWDDVLNHFLETGSYNDINKSSVDRLTPDLKVRLQDLQKKEAENALHGRQFAKHDDLDLFDHLEDNIMNGNITDQRQIDAYAPALTESTVKSLRKLVKGQKTIKPNAVKAAYKLMLGSDQQSHSKWNDDRKGDYRAFLRWAEDKIEEDSRPQDIESLAEQWFMKGSGSKDDWKRDDPNTFGEAIQAGRDDFAIDAGADAGAMLTRSATMLESLGYNLGADEDEVTNNLYTQYYLDANRYAEANDTEVSPEMLTAYTILKANKKAINPRTLSQVISQLGGE